MEIINMANETYDRIYAVIATDFKNNLNSELIKELRKSTAKKTRPNLYNISNKEYFKIELLQASSCSGAFSSTFQNFQKDNSFELRLMRIADQIQIDLARSP